MNPQKALIYKKTSTIVEIASNAVYVVYVKILFPFTTVPYLFMSYLKYFATDLGKDAFDLPFLLWYQTVMPCDCSFNTNYYKFFPFFHSREIFDWKTPTTYIFAFIFELIGGAYVLIVAAILLIHGIGSVLMSIAFLDDIRIDLKKLNKFKKLKKTEAELYENLCEFIQFHSRIKQLSKNPIEHPIRNAIQTNYFH